MHSMSHATSTAIAFLQSIQRFTIHSHTHQQSVIRLNFEPHSQSQPYTMDFSSHSIPSHIHNWLTHSHSALISNPNRKDTIAAHISQPPNQQLHWDHTNSKPHPQLHSTGNCKHHTIQTHAHQIHSTRLQKKLICNWYFELIEETEIHAIDPPYCRPLCRKSSGFLQTLLQSFFFSPITLDPYG